MTSGPVLSHLLQTSLAIASGAAAIPSRCLDRLDSPSRRPADAGAPSISLGRAPAHARCNVAYSQPSPPGQTLKLPPLRTLLAHGPPEGRIRLRHRVPGDLAPGNPALQPSNLLACPPLPYPKCYHTIWTTPRQRILAIQHSRRRLQEQVPS